MLEDCMKLKPIAGQFSVFFMHILDESKTDDERNTGTVHMFTVS